MYVRNNIRKAKLQLQHSEPMHSVNFAKIVW